MTTSTRHLSRRHLLAGLGAGAAAARLLPFLPAAARAAETPKRLLVVFHPMGYLESGFFPARLPDGGFQLGETMTALEPWKNHLIIPDGLLIYGAEWYFPDDDNEHGSGMAMTFTGSKKQSYSNGPSIDGVVADHLYAQTQTRFRTLNLGVNAPTPNAHQACFFSKAQTPVNAQNKPAAVFDSLFKDFQGAGMPVDTTAQTRLRAQKKSVIDLVKGDLDRVCAGAGAANKSKCDAHLEAIRSIERRVGSDGPAPTMGCTKPAAPSGSGVAKTIDTQSDLIAAAFACDLTRVATLQLGHCDGGIDAVQGVNHHDTTHAVGDTKGDPTHIENHKRFDRFFADRWAYLLGKLASVQEGDGSSLLDNTLVLFGSDTTTQNVGGFGAHTHHRFPLWMAGGGRFAFKTGRVIDLQPPKGQRSEKTAKNWPVHNRLLTSVAQAFGVAGSTFGTMDPGTGPLPGL